MKRVKGETNKSVGKDKCTEKRGSCKNVKKDSVREKNEKEEWERNAEKEIKKENEKIYIDAYGKRKKKWLEWKQRSRKMENKRKCEIHDLKERIQRWNEAQKEMYIYIYIYIYIYMCVCVCVCVYIYIYIYIFRERNRQRNRGTDKELDVYRERKKIRSEKKETETDNVLYIYIYHIYQPQHLDRIWHKVNFLSGV